MKIHALRHVGAPIALALAALWAPAAGAQQASVFSADLRGLEEVPATASGGTGFFVARVRSDGNIDYTLGYSGLQGTPTQAHIHFGQPNVAGGISVWLCGAQTQNGVGPTQCPLSGTVSGTITSANIIGPTNQLIAATELPKLVTAMRAGFAYANVHSDQVPSGEIRGQITAHPGF
jgi:hypothetical protein